MPRFLVIDSRDDTPVWGEEESPAIYETRSDAEGRAKEAAAKDPGTTYYVVEAVSAFIAPVSIANVIPVEV